MILSFSEKRDISVPGLLLLHGGERWQGGGLGRCDQGRPGGDQQNLEKLNQGLRSEEIRRKSTKLEKFY